jgi:hypothetical protein
MRRGATLVVLGAIVAAVAITTGPRRSNALGAGAEGYQLVAAGDGVRITWTVPNFAVIDTPIDGGGPSAQARLDSLGQSSAFASLPYPGDAFVGLPGLLAGFTGLPAAPAYPLYVRSSHPTVPDQKYEAPGISLSARSGADSSIGSASGGAGGDALVTHPVSRAETTRASDGTLTAMASSAVDAFVVGPLSVRGLVSTAKVVRAPDGRPEVTSSLSAASVRVGDLAAELNDDGLVVAGAMAPVGTDPLAEALARAGIQVAVTRAVTTESGVVAPSLSVTFSQYSELIQRQVTIRYVLGASSASALRTAPPPLPGTDVPLPGESTVGPSEPAGPVPEAPAPDGVATSGGGLTGSAGTTESAPWAPDGDIAAGGGAAPAAGGDATPNRSTTGDREPTAARPFTPVVSESAGWAWGSLYLVLVAAGLVVAGGVELIRSLGVRKP